MDGKNGTRVNYFILVGFPGLQSLHNVLFILFLAIYLFTLSANVLIITAVKFDRSLHTPMYFFICNISVLEIWYTTTFIPKMLSDLAMQDQSFGVSSCIAQFYILFVLASTENFLLSSMSYDRYVAICIPLQYAIIMNRWTCIYLALGSWITGFLAPLVPAVLISRLHFCGPQHIDHFYCDFAPLISLSCTDIFPVEFTFFLLAWIIILTCCLFTLLSYVNIITAILGIPSSIGRMKSFSTCASHLTVVSIYYGAVIFMYVRSKARARFEHDKVIAIFYSFVTPVLNPIIYSLRNNQVKMSLKKAVTRMRRDL
ncbi:olfactory receptor 6F1-like [Ambystoma mexicanum]|uniref:olfactory receptor 6F1-like n=1 Tax=Ambystoma mexicanum TaxID=8296 RepID=UPI0037E8D847